MSTLSEHQADGNAADTEGEIRAVLRTFDVLSSKADKYIFTHAYRYLIALFLLNLLAMITSYLLIVPYLYNASDYRNTYLYPFISFELLFIVGIGLILWTFNLWREHVPRTLEDIFENDRIYIPTADRNSPSGLAARSSSRNDRIYAPTAHRNSQYLEFLTGYRDALRNPIKYLPSAVLMIAAVFYVVVDFGVISNLRYDLSHPIINLQDLIGRILSYLILLTIAIAEIGFVYCLGIIFSSLYISGQSLRQLSRTFDFRIEPVHPDNSGGLSELGNFCFASGSPLLIGSAFFIGWLLAAAIFPPYLLDIPTIVIILSVIILFVFPVAIFAFFRPLWSIHTKMLYERKTDEEHYVANIAPLREKIQVLLDANQLDDARIMKGKKELMETLYVPYPTWPFNVRSKLFQTIFGASGSLLVGMVTGLGLPFIKKILNLP